MNLLQIFFIISAIVILILAIDIAKKQKFNALHFLIFFVMGAGLFVFTIFPSFLTAVGNFFGLQRGADLLVYGSIIFLVYFVLLLLSKHVENKESITHLVREIAIQNSEKNDIEGKEVIIIPVYNEERIIDTTVQSIIDKKYENIIVVNDGSTDDTLSKIQAFGDNVTVLHHYSNRGQGASLETGFEYVRRYGNTNYVVCFDADGQHSISDLNTFYEILDVQPDIDIVFGSRFLKKTYSNVPFVRKMILKGAILFTFFLSHIRLTDSHNGYRVMRRKVLDKIHISIDGMGHASEIIDIVASKKIPFAEVPVHIHYTDYSLEKGQSSGNALQIVARFIWNKFFK